MPSLWRPKRVHQARRQMQRNRNGGDFHPGHSETRGSSHYTRHCTAHYHRNYDHNLTMAEARGQPPPTTTATRYLRRSSCRRQPGQDWLVQLSSRKDVQEMVRFATTIYRLNAEEELRSSLDRVSHPESSGHRLGHVGTAQRDQAEHSSSQMGGQYGRDQSLASGVVPLWTQLLAPN